MEPKKLCPYCSSDLAIKHGKRKIKRSIVQIYKCQTCLRRFSDRKLKHKSYDPKTILRAVSFYSLGYTIRQAVKQMGKVYHIKIPESTVHSWIKEHSGLCTFRRLREEALRLHMPDEMIFSSALEHNQIYKFQVHKAKLELLGKELPEQKHHALISYLGKVPGKDFPHHIFTIPPEQGKQTRASQMGMSNLATRISRKENYANMLAEIALKASPNNRERHETIQNFMLINDSTTIAAEVPVYLTGDDIKYFQKRGFSINFENHRTPITGHIDLLQIRNSLIHILDYKPGAQKVNAVNQLTVYALALASRTKLAVRDFKCAWFDEKDYYEFFPLHAVFRKPE